MFLCWSLNGRPTDGRVYGCNVDVYGSKLGAKGNAKDNTKY